ncbi:NADPH-dependent FMN reductase [Streptomyces sp. NRRL F-5727]|uniref:NADPH-dependent FMN reductase n=1 Tax=Streptomyces sp. NRRL F-5727 TaxID=1463871 RepID=UPI0004C7B7D3|nr:NAD(P)H-dependent oxidoreductase [Streptomyces sp. NRRL F-5727]
MTTEPLRVAVIQGSTRDGRLGPVVARWIREHADARPDMTTDLVDLAETPLPTVFPQLGQDPARAEDRELLAAVSPRLADADAFVVVTPEYNHSFPASLKNAIDWHNREWHAKPVGFVAYGGFSAGLRAVEQLRGVFAELHAVTIREAVGLQGVWGRFDPEGRAVDPAADTAAKAMLGQLAWWAEALRAARATSPYGA